MNINSRRAFIKKLGVGTAAISLGNNILASNPAMGFSAKSYRNIIGANERIRVAAIGVNSRGTSMSGTFARQKNAEIACICDVDERAIPKALKRVADAGQTTTPKTEKDLRKVLEDKNIDAIYTATPDHWHAPLTIMGCQAGKHVYVEKPMAHNPGEGEMAVAAARKYDRVVQMGAQRRSAPVLTKGIQLLHDGVIGKVYMAKTWYTNTRKATFLKPGTVPTWLDYDLWQGPAPRVPYQEGLIHYDWHWFWHWGTGEALNNGTHEVDVARWGLGVEFPTRISSIGGRYQYKDDWETPDTQVVTLEYPEATLVWESRSCNGQKVEGLDRGIVFYGEKGSLETGWDGFKIYDLQGKLTQEERSEAEKGALEGRNTASPSLGMDSLHVADFLDAIRNNRRPNCDIELGYKSTVAMLLSNISWRVKRDLQINPENGHIIGDAEAEKLWSRAYEPGWEPKV
ncbi:Gfo/Idh/MocA family protein [Parapedobacter koreensis]|uniref:Tat (Twin-arginine translocation) pathway signal sequence n=1 Tax=Parapedobacter koreensis TaxID=332977 RepID=A0A1H7PTR9_9SPHI|nr:Gfo/Idh/MocA family oxidoreductase [Parapedobacter koreensis]SEL39220.1 Tat (twin-arginine translocation) pathway signal sequence [Parapedobacter koreensis]